MKQQKINKDKNHPNINPLGDEMFDHVEYRNAFEQSKDD